jgi:hypothetical protein
MYVLQLKVARCKNYGTAIASILRTVALHLVGLNSPIYCSQQKGLPSAGLFLPVPFVGSHQSESPVSSRTSFPASCDHHMPRANPSPISTPPMSRPFAVRCASVRPVAVNLATFNDTDLARRQQLPTAPQRVCPTPIPHRILPGTSLQRIARA